MYLHTVRVLYLYTCNYSTFIIVLTLYLHMLQYVPYAVQPDYLCRVESECILSILSLVAYSYPYVFHFSTPTELRYPLYIKYLTTDAPVAFIPLPFSIFFSFPSSPLYLRRDVKICVPNTEHHPIPI